MVPLYVPYYWYPYKECRVPNLVPLIRRSRCPYKGSPISLPECARRRRLWSPRPLESRAPRTCGPLRAASRAPGASGGLSPTSRAACVIRRVFAFGSGIRGLGARNSSESTSPQPATVRNLRVANLQPRVVSRSPPGFAGPEPAKRSGAPPARGRPGSSSFRSCAEPVADGGRHPAPGPGPEVRRARAASQDALPGRPSAPARAASRNAGPRWSG